MLTDNPVVFKPGVVAPRSHVSSVEDLVAPAVAGIGGAVARLFAALQPLVLQYCRSRLGGRETAVASADDVAQEVCIAVLSVLPGYRVETGSFQAFVYGIAAHKVADAYRAAERDHSEPMAELPDFAMSSDDPEQHAIRAEMSKRLRPFLNTLTPQQHEVLVLRLGLGLTAQETARIVRSSPGSVRVIQHQSLEKLRSLLRAGAGTAQGGQASSVGIHVSVGL